MRVAKNGGVTSTYKLDTGGKSISSGVNTDSVMFGTYSGTSTNTLNYDVPMVAAPPSLHKLAQDSGRLTQECLQITARIREGLFGDGSGNSDGEQGKMPYGLQNDMHSTLSDLEQLRDYLYGIEKRIVQEKSK